MQHILPLSPDNRPPPADLATLLGVPPAARVPTEVSRLQGELAAVHAKLARLERKRARLRAVKAKLMTRSAALALQIESLENNPYAILRYQTSVPQQYQGDLWENQPTSTLRLETIDGLGERRLSILLERCPTIGDLEVFRVYEGLAKIPGISGATAAKVERRLLRWLRRNAIGYEPAAGAGDVRRQFQVMPRRLEA